MFFQQFQLPQVDQWYQFFIDLFDARCAHDKDSFSSIGKFQTTKVVVAHAVTTFVTTLSNIGRVAHVTRIVYPTPIGVYLQTICILVYYTHDECSC